MNAELAPAADVGRDPSPLEARRARFIELVTPRLDRAYRLAGLLLGSATEAEDAVQDALAATWRSWESVRDEARFAAWLDRTLVNGCRDRLRRRRVVRFVPIDGAAEPAIADPFAAVLDRDAVLRHLAVLDADKRAIVLLHFWADLRLDDVAARLDIPVGTVKSRLHRALGHLRHRLPEEAPPMTDVEREPHDRLHAVRLPESPATLVRSLDAITRAPVPARRRRTRPIVLLVAAVVLVGGGLIVATGGTGPNPTEDRSTPSAPAAVVASPTQAEPTSPPTPRSTPTFPAEVEGLRVYTVSELQAARAAGELSSGPIALAGYWSYLGLMHSCAAPNGSPGDLEIYCHDGEYGITERDEPAMTLVDPRGSVRPASGPMLTPWVPNEDWVAPLVSLQPVNGQPFPPVPIVVIGHLDDPRAADCRPQARQLCQDRFVMDRIASFDPGAVSTPGITPPPTPFPFDSPPPLALNMHACRAGARTSDFSFIGWMAGTELAPQLESGRTFDNETLAVAITGDVPLEARKDNSGRPYQLMGRRVCIAHEGETGAVEFDTIKGSRYRLYDDGSVVPTLEP